METKTEPKSGESSTTKPAREPRWTPIDAKKAREFVRETRAEIKEDHQRAFYPYAFSAAYKEKWGGVVRHIEGAMPNRKRGSYAFGNGYGIEHWLCTLMALARGKIHATKMEKQCAYTREEATNPHGLPRGKWTTIRKEYLFEVKTLEDVLKLNPNFFAFFPKPAAQLGGVGAVVDDAHEATPVAVQAVLAVKA